jgi:outer membrane protein assembly factor BamB
MAFTKDHLFVGIAPRVIALDRRSGTTVWATKLPGAGMSSLVTVHEDEDHVYAGAVGEVWALDRTTGSIVWHNPLKGFGMREVMFPGTMWHQQQNHHAH